MNTEGVQRVLEGGRGKYQRAVSEGGVRRHIIRGYAIEAWIMRGSIS